MGKTLAILAAITVLAGCAGTTPAPSRTGITPGQSPVAPVLRWLTGTDGLEMTSLLVPRDYAQPTGPQLTIALARLPATDPAQRVGSIVFNPGGPGISGIDTIRYGAGTLFTPAVRARFDIVSFDPRGVGLSSPRIRCLATPPQPGQPYPRNASERAEWIAAAREFDAACQSNSGDLLPFVGTENVVRDLEQIRAALGEPKLTYVGVSYGALIGTLYAERFPTQVRAMILDGPFDPALDAATEASDRAAALQQQLDLFLAWCASDRACTFWSDGRTRQAFDALMARFGDAPINTVSAAQAWVGVLVLLQAGAWTELAQALDDARQGNPTVFANIGAGANSLMDASMAVSCIDWPLPRDAEWYAKLADELQSTAPDFAGLAAYSGLPCAFWPVPSSRVPGPVRANGAPSILVLASTGDAATPYRWGVSLSHQLLSGVLVTRAGNGHGSLGRGNTCINAIADAYLLRLEVPPPGRECP
jgi:pimeloyl-ACP methyl ester carboxylesterase